MINLMFSTNPKHSLIPATGKKMNLTPPKTSMDFKRRSFTVTGKMKQGMGLVSETEEENVILGHKEDIEINIHNQENIR